MLFLSGGKKKVSTSLSLVLVTWDFVFHHFLNILMIHTVFLNQSQTSNAHCCIHCRLQVLFLAYVINAFQLPFLSLVPFHRPHIHTDFQSSSLFLSRLSSYTHSYKFILNSETHFPMGNFLHAKILMSFFIFSYIKQKCDLAFFIFWVLPLNLDSPTSILALSTSS